MQSSRKKENFLSHLERNYIFYFYFSLWALYFAVLWGRIFAYDKFGNLLSRNVGVWGDWAVHLTMGTSMAFRELFLSESPLLLHAPFRYPFLANLISAVLIRLGFPLLTAFTFPSFLLSLAFVGAIFIFYRLVFKSDLISITSSAIFLFNGGWGFLYFLKDIRIADHPLETLLAPPKTYTNMEPLHIKWTSVIDTMLIPQRAFQLGFPLALLILMMVYRFLTSTPRFEGGAKEFWTAGRIKMALAGVLYGILSIAHTHSFVAVGIIIFFWFLGDVVQHGKDFIKTRFYYWLVFGLAAVLAVAPILVAYPLFTGGHVRGVQWFPGWYAHEWGINVIGMWWKNWGLTLPAALLGYLWWFRNQGSRALKIRGAFFVLPFVLLFAMSNLFLFHPWIWDNTKFLIWSSVAFSGFAGYFIIALGGYESPAE